MKRMNTNEKTWFEEESVALCTLILVHVHESNWNSEQPCILRQAGRKDMCQHVSMLVSVGFTRVFAIKEVLVFPRAARGRLLLRACTCASASNMRIATATRVHCSSRDTGQRRCIRFDTCYRSQKMTFIFVAAVSSYLGGP